MTADKDGVGLPEGCRACGSLPIDWAGGADPHAFCARPTPAQEQGNSELIAALEPFQDLFRDFTGKVDGAWFDRFAKACIGARFAINNAKPSTPTEGGEDA